jgi:hypothetical protein
MVMIGNSLGHGHHVRRDGAAVTGLLARQRIAVAMDGQGAWPDNVFIERL